MAGAYLPADIFARYHRLAGNEVVMVSGSDSHGTPIMVEADKRGQTPRAVFEHYHTRIMDTLKTMGITYDLYTHTDTENHHSIAQDFFLRMHDRGYLFRESQKQLYSEAEGRFLPDRYVEGTCPICGYEEARGDQCDNCGNLLDALDLIDPRSKNDGSRPVVRETEHFFLDLPAFSDDLLKYFDSHKSHWRGNVYSFARNYVASGLKPRAFTRDVDWGIPVPLEGWEAKRIYVWFEALMGYFTATVEWAQNLGQPEAWKSWWYEPAVKGYCFIGKDNIPFHTVLWQAELLAVGRIYEEDGGKRLTLPYDVPANEFMNVEGAQLSKSRNWAVWLPDILERYQPDSIRYYLAVSMPETRDSEFSWADFISRNNDELVATWGNLAHRVISFAHNHWGGEVPSPSELRAKDRELLEAVEGGFKRIGREIEAVHLRAGLQEAMRLAREVNGYLDRAPWFSVVKDDKQAAATTVYTALRAIDNLKVLFSPYLPFSSQQLHRTLGYERQLFGELKIQEVEEEERSHRALTYDGQRATGTWERSRLVPGQSLRQPQPLFKKLEPEQAEVEIGRMGS
jgi:methionyl-tRNA synthetase